MLTSCRGLKNKGYSASFVTTSLGRGVRQFSHGLVVTSLRQLHACILPLAGRLQNRTVVPTELRASARRRDLRRTGRRRPHDDLHGEPHYDRSGAPGLLAVSTYYVLDIIAPAGTGVHSPFLLGLLTGVATLIPAIGMKLIYYPYTGYLVWQVVSKGEGSLWFPVVFFSS